MKLFLIPLLIMIIAVSCGKRITGSTSPQFSLNMEAHPDTVLPDEDPEIYCILIDVNGEQIGGETIWLEALDFGDISPHRTTSATEPNGLTIPLLFEPEGNYGTARVTGKIISDNDLTIDSDTVTVEVLPYIVEISMVPDIIDTSEVSAVYCTVTDPITGEHPEMFKHVKFIAPDFGSMTYTLTTTDPDNPNGLTNYVRFVPGGNTGTASVIAQVVRMDSAKTVMGADTAWVVVQ